MKSLLGALALTTALTLPGLAEARAVTLSAQMKDYGGNPAFLAVYLTDAKGAYAGTLWMAGGRVRYFEHLSGWLAASGGDMSQVDGITGASVGSGRTIEVTVNVADALLDAGYVLHVDAAAEDLRASPNDVQVPLTTAGSGAAVKGRRYIASFDYKL